MSGPALELEGRVVRAPFGFDLFLLEADDGRRFALAGGDDELRVDGRRVAVRGELVEDAVGIGMTGDPVLRVVEHRVLQG